MASEDDAWTNAHVNIRAIMFTCPLQDGGLTPKINFTPMYGGFN